MKSPITIAEEIVKGCKSEWACGSLVQFEFECGEKQHYCKQCKGKQQAYANAWNDDLDYFETWRLPSFCYNSEQKYHSDRVNNRITILNKALQILKDAGITQENQSLQEVIKGVGTLSNPLPVGNEAKPNKAYKLERSGSADADNKLLVDTQNNGKIVRIEITKEIQEELNAVRKKCGLEEQPITENSFAEVLLK